MTGDEFKRIRLSLGLTQADLARYLGYSSGETAISNLESGRNGISGPVRRLMEILRDTEGEVLRDDWKPKK